MPLILIKCLLAYKNLRTQVGDGGFWDAAEEKFPSLIEMQRQVTQESEPLANFIENGSDFYTITKQDNGNTSLADLKSAFTNWMRFNHKEKRLSWVDSHAKRLLGNAQYTVKSIHLCKSCNKKAAPNCCHLYSPQNRKKIVCITNMVLQKKT